MDTDPEIAGLLMTADVLFNGGWIANARDIYKTVDEAGYPVDANKFAKIKAACGSRGAEVTAAAGHEPIAICGTMIASTLHFAEGLTEAQKRLAFESGVRAVDIETSSQCNRRCHYCPNSKNDRLSTNRFMPESVFASVIDQLALIDYAGFMHFHGYNEPLMHLDDLLPRIKLARASLPNATLGIYTNGDYLHPAALKALEEAGVNYINLSIHLAPGKAWNESDIFDRVCRKAKELGLQTLLQDFEPGTLIRCELIGSKISICMQQWNIMKVGSKRGDIVQDVGATVRGRTSPCIRPLQYMVINYQGDVTQCCDFVADMAEHKDYVVGNVARESIFDIYSSAQARLRRADALSTGLKMAPCDSCGSNINKPPFDASTQVELDRAIASVCAARTTLAKAG